MSTSGRHEKDFEFDIDKKELIAVIDQRDAWPLLLSRLGGFDKEITSFEAGQSKHHNCPFPNRHSTSGGKNKFRIRKPKGSAVFNGNAICSCGTWDGFSLLMDINAWSFQETLENINQELGDPCNVREKLALRSKPDPEKERAIREKSLLEREKRDAEAQERIAKSKEKQVITDNNRAKRLSELWAKGIPLNSPKAKPFWLYLNNRGINPSVIKACSEDLRFHLAMPYYSEDGELLGNFPCLLALFRDASGKPGTFHRIYITEEGLKFNPDGSGAKKMMPFPSFVVLEGGALQVMPINPDLRILGVSEGIETGLAAFAATGIPCWPCYSDYYLSKFDVHAVKDDTDLLVIWADKDRSQAGERAAKKLKEAAWSAGLPCQIMLPTVPIPEDEKTVDWNDVLRFYGRHAFAKPDLNLILKARSISA